MKLKRKCWWSIATNVLTRWKLILTIFLNCSSGQWVREEYLLKYSENNLELKEDLECAFDDRYSNPNHVRDHRSLSRFDSYMSMQLRNDRPFWSRQSTKGPDAVPNLPPSTQAERIDRMKEKLQQQKSNFDALADALKLQTNRNETLASVPPPSSSGAPMHSDQMDQKSTGTNPPKTHSKAANVGASTSSTTKPVTSKLYPFKPFASSKVARHHNRTFLHTSLAPTTSNFKWSFPTSSKSTSIAPTAATNTAFSAATKTSESIPVATDVNKLPVEPKKNDVPSKKVDLFNTTVLESVTVDNNTNADVPDARASAIFEKREESATVTAAAKGEKTPVDPETEAVIDASILDLTYLTEPSDSSDSDDSSDSCTSESGGEGKILARDLHNAMTSLKSKLNSFKKQLSEKESPAKPPTTTSVSRENTSPKKGSWTLLNASDKPTLKTPIQKKIPSPATPVTVVVGEAQNEPEAAELSHLLSKHKMGAAKASESTVGDHATPVISAEGMTAWEMVPKTAGKFK